MEGHPASAMTRVTSRCTVSLYFRTARLSHAVSEYVVSRMHSEKRCSHFSTLGTVNSETEVPQTLMALVGKHHSAKRETKKNNHPLRMMVQRLVLDGYFFF